MSQINQEFNQYILDLLLPFENFRYIPMIGGYLYYYDQKIIGGIYGNANFMVKITPTSKKYMPEAKEEPPYPGAKPMLFVTLLEEPILLKQMIQEMAQDLPTPTLKQKKTGKKKR